MSVQYYQEVAKRMSKTMKLRTNPKDSVCFWDGMGQITFELKNGDWLIVTLCKVGGQELKSEYLWRAIEVNSTKGEVNAYSIILNKEREKVAASRESMRCAACRHKRNMWSDCNHAACPMKEA